MSDISKFIKEVRSLQVMSPDDDSSKFPCILTGPENYHKWITGLENVIFSLYAPLSDYYLSESNVISYDDMIPLDNPMVVKMVRAQFNNVLMGMLRTSTSEAIRYEIEVSYDYGSTTDQDIAKTIISELREDYSEMTLNATYKLVSEFLNKPKVLDFNTLERYCKGMEAAQQSPLLYNASLRLTAGPADIKDKMLREYGMLTTFNAMKFRLTLRALYDERPKTTAAYMQPKNRRKGRKSKLPPSPCPICEGSHWKSDCPKALEGCHVW